VIFQAVGQPPQALDPLGSDGLGEPAAVLGGQVVQVGGQAASRSGGRPVGWSRCPHEQVFGSMAATYQLDTRRQAPNRICGELFLG
jgi:hypothetical protein